MEIISYIGNSAAGKRRNGFSRMFFKFQRLSKTRNISAGLKTGPAVSPRDFFAGACMALSRFAVRLPGILKSAVFVSAGILVAVSSVKIRSYMQSFASPLEMKPDFDCEEEVLRVAMSKFAMENTELSFDENGNVLGEDGIAITPSSVSVGTAVSYSTYKVKSGETVSSISKKFGLSNISTLIAVNGIDNVRTLRAGQKLKVPNQDGLIYSVKKGDSLNVLSVRFKTSVEEILDVNDLSSKDLFAGQELFIPGARMESEALKKAMGELFVNPIASKYRITSYFGRRPDPFTGVASNHTGIDMACPTGTAIRASMSGKVAYVGWSNVFGNYVIINHGNGYQTLYAHMSKTLCRTGQYVGQGTRIGLVGSTGYSTGPHLHFTVYKNGALVDPLSLIKK